MPRNLSAIAEVSISAIADVHDFYNGANMAAMEDDEENWRERLRSIIGSRSLRDVSLKAGVGAGYLASILSDGDDRRDPSVGRLLKIARELDIPVALLFEEADKLEARQALASTTSKLSLEQIRLLEAFARQMMERPSPPPPDKSNGPDTP